MNRKRTAIAAGGALILAAAVVTACLYRWSGDIPSSEARRLVAQGARLVDVRSVEEYSTGHVEGAVNIPVDDLANRLGDVGSKDRPVVVY